MLYILMFVGAMGQTPANLGTYQTQAACQYAIREIYLQQTMPRGIEVTAELAKSINAVVDVKMKYQREYTCLAKQP